jgi:hypothetical protein
MRKWIALAGLVFALPALAQPVPRVRGKVLSFDGETLILQPDGTSADADWLRVAVRFDTRYVATSKARFGDIKSGDFAGAAVTVGADGKLVGQEVHVYPNQLRGSGEGRFPDSKPGRLMINGTVATTDDGVLTLRYRGAGMKNGVCDGRMPVPIKPDSCAGDAVIALAPSAPVTRLSMADAKAVTPGAMAVVSVARAQDGSKITPGLIIEATKPSP